MSDLQQKITRRFCVFNLVLLAILATWLWYQNQPVQLPDAPIPPGEKIQCISYSPYYNKEVTPLNINTRISPEQIEQDLALLSKQFECVRIYSVGQGLDHVPKVAQKLGMKVYLGVWIGWIKNLNEKELNLAISLANEYPETVKAIIVGNEVLLRGEQSEASLKAYIQKAKQAVKVPVSYADVWEFWRKHPKLENSVDFVTVHILPYWEDKPQPIEKAVDHTINVMHLLTTSFHKPILIGETGWPEIGRQRDGSKPSALNQALYIRSFLQIAQEKKWNYNLIEAFDQPWKRKLEGTVGGYWGIYNAHFEQKFPLSGPLAERNDGKKPLIAGLIGAVIFLILGLSTQLLSPMNALALASLGAAAGLFGLLQQEYLLAACRNQQEYLALGGIAAIGWVTLLAQPSYLFKDNRNTKTFIRFSAIALMLAAIVASYLLITDGRYRDFAIALYALPVLQISLALELTGRSIRYSFGPMKFLIVILMLLAIGCLYQEPNNYLAWVWLAINFMLAYVNWPKKPSLKAFD